jgi:hypothetical protein
MFNATLNSLVAEIRELDDAMSSKSENCAAAARDIADAIDQATIAIAEAADIVNGLPEDDDEDDDNA